LRTSWPSGYGHIRFDELDSTNSEARRRAETGEPGPLWISAARQSHGRGRRGKVWDAGQGNLTASLLLRPQASAAMIGQLSFAAALGVVEMVQDFAPEALVQVKWPNDVLIEGRKLSGILLESGEDSRGRWLAIGIGVNLASSPPGTEFPATSLAQLGLAIPSPEEALSVLAARFAYWYGVWMDEGFERLRTAWLARAGGLGKSIRARLPDQTHEGVFEGIDACGALLLNQQGCVRAIAAGEVFF